MKNQMRIYFTWILVITNLLYAETWGLNILIVTLLTIVLFGWKESRLFKRNKENADSLPENKGQWWLAALIWLTSATAVFLNGGWFANFIYVVAFYYFTSLQQQFKISLPLGIVQTFQSGSTGLVRFFFEYFFYQPNSDTSDRMKKIMRQSLLFLIPVIVLIIFLKLYQMADEQFYEWTKFINLDWISWGFIASYLLLILLMYGTYFFKPHPSILEVEKSLKNEINPTYTDRIQDFFGENNERKLAVSLLAVLNVMLVLYLMLDIKFLTNVPFVPKPYSFYSISIHSGINALIVSLILVIFLITYLFRGALNFKKSKSIKTLAITWIIFNCILVFTTALKNYEYVAQLGFTYKRLGVYLYLFLCLVGLSFALYKVLRALSIWFLIRNMTISFLLVFAVVSLFNWDKFITKYNLTHVNEDQLDLEYLYSLGPDSYVDLMKYHLDNKIFDTDLVYRISNSITYEVKELKRGFNEKSWRSYVLSDLELYNDLKNYHFVYPDDESQSELSVVNLR